MSTHGIPLPEILEAVKGARAQGWSIEAQAWIEHVAGRNVCCPLGACVVVRGTGVRYDQDHTTIAATLGISAAWTEGFADGYDGNGHVPSTEDDLGLYSEGHAAGREARSALKVDGGES